MKKVLVFAVLSAILVGGPMLAQNPTVTMKTSMGSMEIELFADKAPISVENFLAYVDSGYFAGTIFHRVIPNFMIQGGGFDAAMNQKETRDPIQNEAKNGLSNDRGTLAMARTGDPHSATSQFFINSVDNTSLDQPATGDGWGYAVFGKVTSGLDVVDAISAVRTITKVGGHQNSPEEPITIESVTRN